MVEKAKAKRPLTPEEKREKELRRQHKELTSKDRLKIARALAEEGKPDDVNIKLTGIASKDRQRGYRIIFDACKRKEELEKNRNPVVIEDPFRPGETRVLPEPGLIPLGEWSALKAASAADGVKRFARQERQQRLLPPPNE